ncbi:MAG: hypothetical protein K940chlam3_01110, partial [Chlamydiae bacterium]|nr:hypothetical protein [Chlamydiota bacterium]
INATLLAQNQGYKILQNEKLDSFTQDGVLETSRCDFSEFLHVNGTLLAHKCQVYELKVNGCAKPHECVIYGPVFVAGELNADHSVFQDNLSLTCQSSSFSRCVVLKDIQVNKVKNYDDKQVLEITNGAVIKGNITFDSKNGEILLSSDSKIMGGVVGGHIRLFADNTDRD